MPTNIKVLKVLQLVEDSLPDGVYLGSWSAYNVDVAIGRQVYRLETSVGVRGLNISCYVRIKGGEISISTIDKRKSISEH